jgi:two-component system CheB/CheR fusion protein
MNIERLLLIHSEQTTDQASLLLDVDGMITWCNPAAARMFGYTREQMAGMSLHHLFTAEDVQQGVPDYELHVASRSADMSNDRWLQRGDGSVFWASGSTTALRDHHGAIIGFAKTLRNRTDVKEQLEMFRNRVDALLQADEHKNIFLSTLSHELRNPLAPLTNALQLIRMTDPQNSALQYPIKLIERQVEFIRRLVDDLLDITRISAGKVQLALEPIDLRDVLARAVESTRPLVKERRHNFAQHMLPSPIVVNADAGRLEQVFVNLLTNAAKYTPEGGSIELRASMEQTEALVHVLDNGVGIPENMQPHVFDLFTQVEANAAESNGGLGIGLSVVKNLVELHGGSVQVRSEGAAKGTEFTVRLPLTEPQRTRNRCARGVN